MDSHKIFLKLFILYIVFCFIQFSNGQTEDILDNAKQEIFKNNYTEAISGLQKIPEGSPDFAEALHLMGAAYYELEEYENAIRLLRRTLSLEGYDADIKILLARASQKLGRIPEAIKILKEVLNADSLNRKAHRHLAAIYFKRQNYRAALKIYEKLRSSKKPNAYLLRQAGICAFRLKQYKKAEQFFHKVLKMNSQDLNAHIYLANTYNKMEQQQAALQAVINGLSIYPQSKFLNKLKGDIYFEKNEYGPAITAYLKIVDSDIMNAVTFSKLGLCYYHTNNFPAALLALQKANEADSSNALNLYYLGLTFQKLKNDSKALLYLEKSAREIIPDYTADIFAWLANCYDNEKKYNQAISAYKKAMSLDPERKIYLFFIASLYDRYYKDRQIPMDYYIRFLEEAPEADEKYKNYALERITALKEKLHFQK